MDAARRAEPLDPRLMYALAAPLRLAAAPLTPTLVGGTLTPGAKQNASATRGVALRRPAR